MQRSCVSIHFLSYFLETGIVTPLERMFLHQSPPNHKPFASSLSSHLLQRNPLPGSLTDLRPPGEFSIVPFGFHAELISQPGDLRAKRQALKPRRRNTGLAVVCSSDLAAHCGRRIGVVAQIGGHENRVLKALSACEGPQGSLEAFDDLAGPANIRLGLFPVGSASDRRDTFP